MLSASAFDSADKTDFGLNNSWYHGQPHPIIVYYPRILWLIKSWAQSWYVSFIKYFFGINWVHTTSYSGTTNFWIASNLIEGLISRNMTNSRRSISSNIYIRWSLLKNEANTPGSFTNLDVIEYLMKQIFLVYVTSEANHCLKRKSGSSRWSRVWIQDCLMLKLRAKNFKIKTSVLILYLLYKSFIKLFLFYILISFLRRCRLFLGNFDFDWIAENIDMAPRLPHKYRLIIVVTRDWIYGVSLHPVSEVLHIFFHI